MKYYFEDIGVRNACIGFRQLEPTHMMENVVYNELLVRGYSIDVGAVDVMEAGKRKRLEIDFVATLGNRRYYIQSAYALPTFEKKEQEERSLLSVKDAFKKIVVTASSQKPHYDENGILIMGLKQFLLDSASLEY
jgi:predicted AAA+ superfamily ATPase